MSVMGSLPHSRHSVVLGLEMLARLAGKGGESGPREGENRSAPSLPCQ